MPYLNHLIQNFNPALPTYLKVRASRAITIFMAAVLSTALTMGMVTVVRAASGAVLRAVANPITATKADAFVGGDLDGKADPGETIRYTTVISNSNTATSDATGVTFNDLLDANTTLVGGSINVSPLAINDSYETFGNTLLDVGTSAADPAVHVSGNLFANDVEFLSDTFGAAGTHITSNTAPTSGTLTLNANTGTFTYLPNAGFSGTDSFTYTLTDTAGLTDTGTVTINVVVSKVWYVKNNATAGGLGRSTDPFDTLAGAQTASGINDTIYIFAGDGTTTNQNSGITLKNGQRLLGQGVALTVPVALTQQGTAGSSPTTLLAAGTRPLIGNSAGDGVSLSTASIAGNFSGVEIRGLNISGTGAGSNGVDVTTSTTFSGSVELADNIISAAGLEGIDVNGGSSGTLTLSLHNNTANVRCMR